MIKKPVVHYLFLFIIFYSLPAVAEIKDTSGLFPVKVDGKLGYIDITGKVIIEPHPDRVSLFNKGLAREVVANVNIDELGNIILKADKTGKMILKPPFDLAFAFSEGLAAVRIEKNNESDIWERWFGDNPHPRCILNDSAVMRTTKKTHVWSKWFGKQYRVEYINYGYGYIDKTGRIFIKPEYTVASNFSEGLAAVGIGDCGYEWGYIDRNGKFVIPPQFESIRTKAETSAWPFIFQGCERSRDFSEGLALVWKWDEKWGFIDKTGAIFITPQFDAADKFSEGLAPVKVSGKWGYIDKNLKMVIKPKFDSALPFGDGLAAVNVGGRAGGGGPTQSKCLVNGGHWGYIDKTGNVKIKPSFGYAYSFSGGLAKVCIGESETKRKCGYIDKTGKYIWEPTK